MATVTNYEERLSTALEGLVLAVGGTLPSRESVSSEQQYRLALAEAASDGAVSGATFTIGTEAANAINVAIQLTDGNSNNLAHAATCYVYLAADTAGQTIGSGVGTPAGLAIGTDGLYQQVTQHIAGFVTCEADGDIDLTITNTGTGTQYLVVVLPSGKLAVSGAITFA
jgi:hypothetical protein